MPQPGGFLAEAAGAFFLAPVLGLASSDGERWMLSWIAVNGDQDRLTHASVLVLAVAGLTLLELLLELDVEPDIFI